MELIYWLLLLIIILVITTFILRKKVVSPHSKSNQKKPDESKKQDDKSDATKNKDEEEESIPITLTQDEIDGFINQEIYEQTIGVETDHFSDLDDLFVDAARLIVSTQRGSTALIQRRFSIGYNRSGRIMDQLQQYGIVGPPEGSRARLVLIQDETSLDRLLFAITTKDPKRIFFEENILPLKSDFIKNKVNEYYEEKHKEELKEQLRQEILVKENEKMLRRQKEDLKEEVIEELIQSGLINKDDYFMKKREPIPQDIQDKVWNRDGGKCVKCGSQENLEFDHIIPFSKGGSNTYRNLQLLCQKCNREKSNNIG